MEVVLYDMAGRLTTERLIACGYSPIALMVAILLGFVMVCTILGMGLKHFRTNMPLAVSCSAAISAACHPPPGHDDHALKPVMWGETSTPRTDDADRSSEADDGGSAIQSASKLDTRYHSSIKETLQGPANESQTQLLSKGKGSEDDGEAITPIVSSPYIEGRFSDEVGPCTDQAQGSKSYVDLLGESRGVGERNGSTYGHCSFSSIEVSTPSTERLYL